MKFCEICGNEMTMIQQAIRRVQGGPFQPGQVVAHPSDPITREFVRSEGSEAVTTLDGKEKRFPIAEMFDPNRARDEALKIKFGLPERFEILGLKGDGVIVVKGGH